MSLMGAGASAVWETAAEASAGENERRPTIESKFLEGLNRMEGGSVESRERDGGW